MPTRAPTHYPQGRDPKTNTKRHDLFRGSASERGYDWAWSKLRDRWIWQHPLCAECERQDRLTPATEVDHIIPIRGAPERRLDDTNLQSLCHRCHATKTAKDAGQRG
jgi:5-methylcytosine-specific restriction protein A